MTARFFLVLALVLTPAIASAGACVAPKDQAAVGRALLDAANAERRRAGVPELTWSARLAEAARLEACQMASNNKMAHSSGTVRANTRKVGCRSLGVATENVAHGYKSVAATTKAWMEDPPHRYNMLLPTVVLAGASYALSANGETYWAMVYSARCTS